MDAYELLESRKSVRTYTGEAVPGSQESRILRAAELAPVGMGRFEDFHLTVIKNPQILKQIELAAALMLGKPDVHPLYGAPELVLVSAKDPEQKGNVAYSGAAIIAHNMVLAAENQGLGACYIWGAVAALNQNPDLVSALELPEGFLPCCGVIFGATTEILTPREVDSERIRTNVLSY